jgi:formylglycine-generating enzyme required for sulfatase activity
VQNISVDPNANGYRLPAHHQWIWAAMGADMSPGKLSTVDGISGVNAQDYHKNFAGYNGSNSEADYVWFNDTTGGVPKPVQLKKPNELGLWDMSGNMGEWCYDQAAPATALVSFPRPGSPTFWVPKPMGDNDHYFADIRKVLAGGSYTSSISDLTFGYVPDFIRFMDQKTRSDQGLRVMRWVGTGE